MPNPPLPACAAADTVALGRPLLDNAERYVDSDNNNSNAPLLHGRAHPVPASFGLPSAAEGPIRKLATFLADSRVQP